MKQEVRNKAEIASKLVSLLLLLLYYIHSQHSIQSNPSMYQVRPCHSYQYISITIRISSKLFNKTSNYCMFWSSTLSLASFTTMLPLSALQTHWLSFYFLNMPSTIPPQDLWTNYYSCLGLSFSTSL